MKAGTRARADIANLAEALFHCAVSISATHPRLLVPNGAAADQVHGDVAFATEQRPEQSDANQG
jgi:hypothetical protein